MRKTIGTNPLDAVVPNLVGQTRTDKTDAASGGSDGTRDSFAGRSNSAKKERMTLHIPVALIERAKNTVFWTPGLTLADLGERALDALVSDLEQQNGGAFETRPHELKGGRPLK